MYAAFLYGNGKPTDNNAFEVLDISGLQPKAYTVQTMRDAASAAVASYSEDVKANDNAAGAVSYSAGTDANGDDANKTYTEESINHSKNMRNFIPQKRNYSMNGHNIKTKLEVFF